MRIAMIGSGLAAGIHAQALTELGYTIAVVINENLNSAEAFRQKWNAGAVEANSTEAFSADIDAIHICTPPALHYKIAKDALKAGKHVICEKPLCLSIDEAEELVLLAQERNLVGAVSFNYRYYDACQSAKSMIAAPEFGGLCLAHGSYLQEYHALPQPYGWRYKPELAGPMRATTEIGSHWIDLVRFWTGLEICEVSANYGRFAPERFVSDGVMYADPRENSKQISVESEDAAVIAMRFSNGALGNLLLSEVSHGRHNQLQIEVTGLRQSVWWNSEAPSHLHYGRKCEGILTQVNALDGSYVNAFKRFFAEVYQDINTGQSSERPRYPTFHDGMVNAAVCEAIYQSAANNAAWVKVATA